MKKKNDRLLDHLGKLFLIHDNLFNILLLTDENFSILQKSLIENPQYPNNPTRKQLVAEKTTAMLFQLTVGYLFNLTEVVRFLKKTLIVMICLKQTKSLMNLILIPG